MSKNVKHEKRLPNGMRVTSKELHTLFDLSDVDSANVQGKAAEAYLRCGVEIAALADAIRKAS